MSVSRRLVRGLAALVLLAWPVAAAPAWGSAQAAAPAPSTAPRTGQIDGSGLHVTISGTRPLTLRAGQPLTVTGTVTNAGQIRWQDAQVYLQVLSTPATTRTGLAEFAASPGDQVFGERLAQIGQFAEIGDLPPDATKRFRLQLRWGELPLDGGPGVYHVGVSVLAGNRDGRDLNADAVADTLLSLLPPAGQQDSPTQVVTMLPIVGHVHRRADGTFTDERLALDLAEGGRLRNLMDFAAQAPADSLQIAADPALIDAVRDMSAGYVVRPFGEDETEGTTGSARDDAAAWISDFDQVVLRQSLTLLPWGNPHINSLTRAGIPGVYRSAVNASKSYAEESGLDAAVVGWQQGGMSTRKSIAAALRSGVNWHVVSDQDLELDPDSRRYPPVLVDVPTHGGTVQTLVAASQVAGEPIRAHTSVLDLRQRLIAEATVRSIGGADNRRPMLVALPFGWDPLSSRTDVSTVGSVATVDLESDLVTPALDAFDYTGRVLGEPADAGLSAAIIKSILDLRSTGKTLVGLVAESPEGQTGGEPSDDESSGSDGSGDPSSTESVDTQTRLDQQLGMASSSSWIEHPRIGRLLTREVVRANRDKLGEVTISGPAFVTQSSESGRFPLTVTNGLDVPVTVQVEVRSRNPALEVEPLEPITLTAGQRRDVELVSSTNGSGLTTVRARLVTTDGRPVGRPWEFEVRATQIGLVIWVVMGVGAAVLFGAAGYRIFQRIRRPGPATREEPRSA